MGFRKIKSHTNTSVKIEGVSSLFCIRFLGHQEDLYRRSFLEELTYDLCENQVIDSGVWRQKLKDLLSRKRETLTRTIPRLSGGVIWTVFIAIFTPITQTVAETIDNDLAKLFVAFAPVLVGIFAYLFASLKKCRLLSIGDIYSIYREDQLTNESHETFFESEPSVRQFRIGWMILQTR